MGVLVNPNYAELGSLNRIAENDEDPETGASGGRIRREKRMPLIVSPPPMRPQNGVRNAEGIGAHIGSLCGCRSSRPDVPNKELGRTSDRLPLPATARRPVHIHPNLPAKDLQIGLIYFDRVGFTVAAGIPLLSGLSPLHHGPVASSPISGWSPSRHRRPRRRRGIEGAGNRRAFAQPRLRSQLDSLAPTSPDLTGAGYSIGSRRPSASRQNASNNALIALVRQEKPAHSLQYERRLPCKLII